MVLEFLLKQYEISNSEVLKKQIDILEKEKKELQQAIDKLKK